VDTHGYPPSNGAFHQLGFTISGLEGHQLASRLWPRALVFSAAQAWKATPWSMITGCEKWWLNIIAMIEDKDG